MLATELGHIISTLFRFRAPLFWTFLYKKTPEKSHFFTVSGSTLLRENVFIRVLVYPDFLLALEPGEKN